MSEPTWSAVFERLADEVYAEIEGLSRDLVEKSAGVLTEAQAMDRVLETTRGKELLAEYYRAKG